MEFFNILYTINITFILFNIFNIPIKYYLIIFGHFVLIFLLNDVLFSAHYMPDQFRYFNTASTIRETFDFTLANYYTEGGNLLYASLLFALFPIPYIHSLFSLAMINFMLYTLIFIFLYKKEILQENALLFYLLFPSFAIYAGVALRDIWILFFMIISIYLLYKEKLIFSIIFSLPLLWIKYQNFYIYILSLFVFQILKKGSFFSFRTFIKLIFSIGLFYIVLSLVSIDTLNLIRYNMYIEDGGKAEYYIPLQTYSDLIFEGILGAFYMILKPLPWESTSALQLFQSFENIFVFYLIYKIIKEQLIVKDKFINFLLIYFFIAMMIYGIIVFNYGTAARYRFTFELIFIVFSMNILQKKVKKK